MKYPSVSRTTLLLVALSATAALRAQGVDVTGDKWRMSAGWQFTSIDTSVTMGTANGLAVGTKLDFENTFDVPVQKQAWAFDATWRFSPRHLLDFGYQEISRTGGRKVNLDLEFGKYQIHAGGQIDATFKSKFPYAGYRYGFYQGGDLELSVGGGLTYLTLGAGLSASGALVTNVENGSTQSGGKVYQEFSFPAPLVAFQIDGRLSKDWYMTGYIRPIFYKSSDFKGGLLIWGVNANWFCTRHFGLGLGIERTVIKANDVKTGDYIANFNYNIIGAKVSGVFRF